MPFDSETGAAAGKKYGAYGMQARWGDKDPSTVRNKRTGFAFSEAELQMIDEKANAENISRTELIVRAVQAYKAEKDI